MAQQQMTSSQKALMLELKSLQEEPVEGFRITLVDESDLYNWEVAIFGPPNTLYEGGYFKNGDVCISILHPPVDDPQSGELPSERWNPTQNVRKQVSATKAEAEKDGVKVPTTLAEYCIKTKVPSNDNSSDLLYDDLYDDDIDDEDEEEEDADCYDDDDSGNEES
ncbi:ubiquitin-conjugating enzyme E2 R2 isoform X3 [Homo sapiens]|uniref:ubiquitin-conjugating enzyme E2 R2 isoform X3 n=1 Tax=Homo sapiens TaxID=9606 RepID=UPI0000211295|nr:ubiquitin-conjugating enzyme E2 R2 isoform X3 [Homo sapiens]XP_054219156.1 ubiquitin-conjugating enzyme E2 R2 isoform X3 [Homo sapiens]|eukprot:XP_016870349.1 ubiquitin-conjugating enzyme E2 R2 isoform X3 [Homo sapiens]